jgi:hypothetical protein
VRSNFEERPQSLEIHQRIIEEALNTGLSREPVDYKLLGTPLSSFASVMRGIATGANDFFFLTRKNATELGIPEEFLRVAIGRTRDVPSDEITHGLLEKLERSGRPTRLFAPDGRPLNEFPTSVKKYLKHGIKQGLSIRPLISQRKPWYKMEMREPPAFLFAYLGRRNARFMRNTAKVLPLTCFLCVYPKDNDPDFIERLWGALSHPLTISNLKLVGKSYGDGAIKVEPRALERLLIPNSILEEVDLPRMLL